jgi:GxxExxY protein
MANLTEKIMEISEEVWSSLGPGYNEVVYHRAFEIGLRLKHIEYESEKVVPIFYKGHTVGHSRIDLEVCSKVVIELKAVNSITSDAVCQIKNYMKLTGLTEGLIVNFGQPNKSGTPDLTTKWFFEGKVYDFFNGEIVNEIDL